MITYEKRKHSNQAMKNFLTTVLVFLAIATVLVFGSQEIAEEPTVVEVANPVEAVSVETVDFTGSWLGIVTEDYGAMNRYEYRLELTQDGNTVVGTAYDASTNREQEIFASSIIEGTVEGDTLVFEEVQLTELSGIPVWNWCLTRVTLNFEDVDGMDTITGTWEGIPTEGVGNCQGISGRAVLTLQPEF